MNYATTASTRVQIVMADKRKLQGEIERCLKKVTEGVETFEEIWQKVHGAVNTNHKEKYEADLKKEIKKLQRLRDQIKTWLASSEIKDKRILQENRKLIEMQMERFKVVERETKTKAYSKEGLGAAQKLDPAQKEKDDITCWLSASIDSLNMQVDHFECEIESLTICLKKKKSDKDKQDRIEQLKAWLEKHRYHIKQLETLLRMLDNSTVEVDNIKKIKEDVEYYIESSQDFDFEENEYVYEDLDLEDMQEFLVKSRAVDLTHFDEKILPLVEDDNSVALTNTPASTNSSSPTPSPGLLTNHSKIIEGGLPIAVKAHNSSDSSSIMCPVQSKYSLTPSRNNSISSQSSSSNSPSVNSHNCYSVTLPPPSVAQYTVEDDGAPNCAENKVNSPMDSRPVNCLDTLPTRSPCLNSSHSLTSSIPASSSNNANHNIVPSSQSHSYSSFHLSADLNHNSSAGKAANISSGDASVLFNASATTAGQSSLIIECEYLSMQQSANNNGNITHPPLHMNGPLSPKAEESLKSIGHQSVLSTGLDNLNFSRQVISIEKGNLVDLYENTINNRNSTITLQSEVVQTTSVSCLSSARNFEAHIPPLLGVDPLGIIPLTKDCHFQLHMLEAAARHLPYPSDSERLRPYLPRNPCPVPSYYPTSFPYRDSVDFFQRLSTESLFFIFYYMEGSKAQYLAAKALKKQSWRFHTKYMMWFQRHEEPKTITDEYEQGTYLYFDYEKWGQRRKDGFTFEYRYLEDQDLN